MTVNALGRSTPTNGQEPAITIGDPDGQIFVCASCSRPLASGVRRCPGCHAAYVLDVPVRKAGLLMTMGLAAGIIVGGGVIGIGALARPATGTPATPVPTSEPIPSASLPPAQATPGASGPTASVPFVAVASLRGTATINGRIAEIAGPLASSVATQNVDASMIARHLRRLSVEVGAAETLVAGLSSWDVATTYAADLDVFYGTLLARVRAGLDSSVRDEAAYRKTATDVLAILEALPELEATGRTLATRAAATP